MTLEERLNTVLAEKGLINNVEPVVERKPVVQEQVDVNFESLDEATKSIDQIEADEDGLRIFTVLKIDLPSINLPMQTGEYIIEDIQKRPQGYEVHLRNK